MSEKLAGRLAESEEVRRCGWPDCRAACCVYGVWVGETEVEKILAHAELVKPHMAAEVREPGAWFDKKVEPDPFVAGQAVRHTKVLSDPEHYGGTACVFLRGDYRCALQCAGEAEGMHPWHLKPYYCILHPLELDAEGRITLDEVRHMVNEPASCVRSAQDPVVLRKLFREEIEYLSK